jgi:hypothetical protein
MTDIMRTRLASDSIRRPILGIKIFIQEKPNSLQSGVLLKKVKAVQIMPYYLTRPRPTVAASGVPVTVIL